MSTISGQAPDRSRAFRLRRGESVGDGLRRIATGRAASALERLRQAEGGESPATAIHGARKDLKKVRAVLRLARAELGGKLFRAENRRYRDAARLLSASRDAEVRLATLAALRESAGGGLLAATTAWQAELAVERDRVAAPPAGATDAALAAIEEGRERIADWPLDGCRWATLGAALERTYRAGRLGHREAIVEPSDEATHEWRKRGKDLWYQLRILTPAWPPVLEPTAEQAHALAELLGDHHDLTLLATDLGRRDAVGAADRERILAAIAHRQSALFADALALGARLYAEKPRAYRRRLRGYWKAWRD